MLLFKCMHCISDKTLGELGISTSRNNERSGQFRLQVDRSRTKTISSLFKYLGVNEWNNLTLNTRSLSLLATFRHVAFMIYLIYNHPNFNYFMQVYTVLLTFDYFCVVSYRFVAEGVLNVSFGTCLFFLWNK